MILLETILHSFTDFAVLRTLTDPSLHTALTALVILAVLSGLSILIRFTNNEAAADTSDAESDSSSDSDTAE